MSEWIAVMLAPGESGMLEPMYTEPMPEVDARAAVEGNLLALMMGGAGPGVLEVLGEWRRTGTALTQVGDLVFGVVQLEGREPGVVAREWVQLWAAQSGAAVTLDPDYGS